MTPLRVTLALVLVMVTVLLVAGCTNPETLPSCSAQLNSTPWIIIDNISDHYVWDDFTLTGTTNLNTSDELDISVYERENTCPFGVNCKFYSNAGKVRIYPAKCGINTWTYSTNLSGAQIRYCNPGPDCRDYYVSVHASSDRHVRNDSAGFHLLTGPQPGDDPTTYTITRGEPFSFNVAFRAPEIRVWLFGENSINMTTITVNSGNFFTIHIDGSRTAALKNGTYTMLLQYPGRNGKFGISLKNETSRIINERGDVIVDSVWVENGIITGDVAKKNFMEALGKSENGDMYLEVMLDIRNPEPIP